MAARGRIAPPGCSTRWSDRLQRHRTEPRGGLLWQVTVYQIEWTVDEVRPFTAFRPWYCCCGTAFCRISLPFTRPFTSPVALLAEAERGWLPFVSQGTAFVLRTHVRQRAARGRHRRLALLGISRQTVLPPPRLPRLCLPRGVRGLLCGPGGLDAPLRGWHAEACTQKGLQAATQAGFPG